MKRHDRRQEANKEMGLSGGNSIRLVEGKDSK